MSVFLVSSFVCVCVVVLFCFILFVVLFDNISSPSILSNKFQYIGFVPEKAHTIIVKTS